MKYLVILVVLVALAGGGWIAMDRMKTMNASAAVPPTTDKVARRTVEKIVSANGKVASNRDVDIKCQASGTIKTLPYKDVSKEVKPGEMLCQLDPVDMQRLVDTASAVVDADKSRITEAGLNRDMARMSLDTTRQHNEATLASSRAQATDAHAKAERTRQLYESKPTALASKEELDTALTTAAQADAAVQNAQAAIAELDQQKIQIDTKEQQIKQMTAALAQDQSRLDTAKQNVDYCTVSAPIADNPADPPRWFISSLLTNIAPGYIVQSGTSGFSAGTTIMTLSDLSHVYILASVEESDIGSVIDPARGGEKQKVRATADSFNGQTFEGEVVRVATKGVNTNNVVTFEVKIEITSENRTLLRPEMTSTVNIICDARPDVLAIPSADFTFTGGADKNAAAATTPADPAAAPATAVASAPSTRRGRGGGGGGGRGRGPTVTVNTDGPKAGNVTVLTDAGATETRNVVVGLLGTDPADPRTGEVYEVLSGLTLDDVVVRGGGQDSRFRNQGPILSKPFAPSAEAAVAGKKSNSVSGESLLWGENLIKTYVMGAGDNTNIVHALDGVSLAINEGEMVAIRGPSGSGKSTLMNILGCLDRPTSGRYVLDGDDVSKMNGNALARVRNKSIGFVFQTFNLLPRMNALENVELPLLYAGSSNAKKKAMEALRIVGLAERADHKPNQLSGGQRQRVSIARAIVTDPAIVLADEPTGALDTRTGEEILALFTQLNTQGRTIIVVTHDLKVAGYCQREIYMRDGKVVPPEIPAIPPPLPGHGESATRRRGDDAATHAQEIGK